MDKEQSVSDQLEEMRCLIELQQREIYRQQRRIELQRQRIDYIQGQLDAVDGNGAAPSHNNRNSPAKGNGHGTGNRHHVARSPGSETNASNRRA
jgi:hypothetical protein